MTPDSPSQNLTFTVDFHFFKGKSYCDGFVLESSLSKKIGAKYRFLVRDAKSEEFVCPEGMDVPLSTDESHEAIEKLGGSVAGNEFIFEAFDSDGHRLFTTEFNAEENFPIEGYEADRITVTSYSWTFELPKEVMV